MSKQKSGKKRIATISLIMALVIAIVAFAGAYVFWMGYGTILGESTKLQKEVSTLDFKDVIKGFDSDILTNLEVRDALPLRHREIDRDVQKVLEEGNYTFEEPLVVNNPFEIAPLTSIVIFNTEDRTQIRLTVVGDTEADTFVHDFPASEEHRIPIIGLYPDRENTVYLETLKDGKPVEKKEIKIKTEALPSLLKGGVEVVKADKPPVNGITVVSGHASRTPYAFDSSGQIRWFVDVDTEGHGYFPMANGRYMLMTVDGMLAASGRPYSTQIYDMDFLGRVHYTYFVPRAAHHEIMEKTPNGNLLILSGSLSGPNKTRVEDLIVELDRETGEIVNELDLGTVLKVKSSRNDWAHLNTISYNADDDTMVLSVRNYSTGLKIDWPSGKIRWILSDPEIWKGTEYEKYVLKGIGEHAWFYEQHTIYEMTEDLDNNPETIDVLMFDNRSFRVNPRKLKVETKKDTSAVIHYAVNEKDFTVSQVRRYTGPYSYVTSGQEVFFDQNKLIGYFGSVKTDEDKWGEVHEFDFDTGKLVHVFKTAIAYYRGYRQPFNFDTANVNLEDDTNLIRGNLLSFDKENGKVKTPFFKTPNEISLWIAGGVLYINAPETSISRVEFAGEDATYNVNMIANSSLNLGMKQFIKSILKGKKFKQQTDKKYTIAVQLRDLPKGKYNLNLVYLGIRCNTQATIELK